MLLTASGAAKLGDVGLSKRQDRTYLSDVSAVGTFDWCADRSATTVLQPEVG